MVAYGRGEITLACTGRACDEDILVVAHEVERGQPVYLIAIQSAFDGVIDPFERGFVAEARRFGKAGYPYIFSNMK